jgi:hypothetical protein
LELRLKEQIVKALKWALSKFEDKTPQVEAWPFPVEQEKPKKQVKKPAIVKKRIALKKATTRKTVAKKATKVAKKAK